MATGRSHGASHLSPESQKGLITAHHSNASERSLGSHFRLQISSRRHGASCSTGTT